MSLAVALRHRFPGFALDVAFEAPPGVTALFGHSGSGKTSVVNAVAGLLRPEAGRIVAGDAVLTDTEAGLWVPPHRRRIGYVFQEGRLFPHLTVRQNLLYGRWMVRAPAEAAAVARVVDMLGIGALLARRPGALSGGEKQRVAIGRALLGAPRLLLMDEPLAALDAPRQEEILPYLERVRDEGGVPILYVSHRVAEVARLATTVAVLEAGRVVRSGPVGAVLADPESVLAVGRSAVGAVLAGHLVRHHADGLSEVALSSGWLLLPHVSQAPLGAAVRVRIAAQDVTLSLDPPGRVSALNVLPVVVRAVRGGEGPGALVQLEAGTDRLLARVTRRSAEALGLAPGLACFAMIKAVAVARSDVGTTAEHDDLV